MEFSQLTIFRNPNKEIYSVMRSLKIMQQGMVRRAEESGIGRDGKEILEKG
jgi:hypothetical protein